MSGRFRVHEPYKRPRALAVGPIEMQVETSSANLDLAMGRGIAGPDDYDKATRLCFEALRECAPEGLAARELVQRLSGMDKEVHITPIKLNRLISSFLERFHPQGGTPAELEKFPIVRHSSDGMPKRYIYHYAQPHESESGSEPSELEPNELEPSQPTPKRKQPEPDAHSHKKHKKDTLLPMSMEEFLSFDKQMVMEELELELALI